MVCCGAVHAIPALFFILGSCTLRYFLHGDPGIVRGFTTVSTKVRIGHYLSKCYSVCRVRLILYRNIKFDLTGC